LPEVELRVVNFDKATSVRTRKENGEYKADKEELEKIKN
jgi:hypothetical protein